MPSTSAPRRRRRNDDWAWDSATRRRVRPRTGYVPRGPRRNKLPSLQVDQDVYAAATAIDVNTHGADVSLLTNFLRGTSEDARHTNETILYKLSLDLYIMVDDVHQVYSGKSVCCCWLVYDAQPTGALPDGSSIFSYNADLLSQPAVWKVGREVCHRFVVKRRWVFTLETNGCKAGTLFTNTAGTMGIPPCNRSIYFHKFCKRLGVRTEWKNSSGGTIGDIKTGAFVSCVCTWQRHGP
ncbi:capsid protein [Axonopus compressus streak virus]|uniref:Capsid protein n=1 Tax=Axonopus compressus streak virus TaxID=1476487 RepID=X2EZP9_9GEMI|nr:capsid protein [Axonopus compressus streak virus]AHM88322.1 capsid protein [Axonopus compressus streak virus]